MRSTRRHTIVIVLALAAAALAPPAVAQEEQPPDPPATALRVAIDRALGEHAFLLGEVVRGAIAGEPEFDAAAAVLEQNSGELIAVMADVYGTEAGNAFAEQWRNPLPIRDRLQRVPRRSIAGPAA
jgi:hypothetical protein